MTVPLILDAVERWATGCVLLRETELIGFVEGEGEGTFGRLDGLLVPVGIGQDNPLRGRGGWVWQARRLYGVEVKLTRADFQRGLAEGQFTRYREALGGLYLATPKGLVHKRDVPEGVGLLERHFSVESARCVKLARGIATQASPAMLWKILYLLHDRHRDHIHAIEERAQRGLKKFGEHAGWAIGKALREIRRR